MLGLIVNLHNRVVDRVFRGLQPVFNYASHFSVFVFDGLMHPLSVVFASSANIRNGAVTESNPAVETDRGVKLA